MRIFFCLAVAALFSSTSAYFIHIDANEEQCFFDRVVSGTKMGLMFEVAEGGFLDIDVKVCQNNPVIVLRKSFLLAKRNQVIYE